LSRPETSSTLDDGVLKDELPDNGLEDPEEKDLDDSRSLPVFLSLTDFISSRKAAILSGVIPIVGWP